MVADAGPPVLRGHAAVRRSKVEVERIARTAELACPQLGDLELLLVTRAADDQRRFRHTTPGRLPRIERGAEAEREEVWAAIAAQFEYLAEVATLALGGDQKVPVVDDQRRNFEDGQNLLAFVAGADHERLTLFGSGSRV